ncbi:MULTISPECIES: hypothetical protein [Halorubrum]|uniref:Uncharacterized protein n=1 Tax=Halorubrum hochstenium ATCC 700873 TaxID=1227481 RepID=M0FD08_9EURY|nr:MULTISPECIES: hypothetical protein [Halorubrum]ELZ57223.1 hypothetical protein C467_07360 [Halorubrum hochstenium ATCC 700873]
MTDPSSPSDARTPPPTDRDALDDAVRGYRRAERAVSWTLALLVVGAFLAAVAALSFWPGVAVGAVLVVALRLPVYRRSGMTRLRTDAPPEAVVRQFASGTPPVLAFQWGVAADVRTAGSDAVDPDSPVDTDAVDPDGPAEADTAASDRPTGTRATYEFSYLLGLRSVALGVETEVRAAGDGDDASPGDAVATVDVDGTVGDRQWASYAATVREGDDGGSVVDVELRPTRRFGLRRLPQGRVAERYYAPALAAQGYEVVDRAVGPTR